MPKTVTIQMGSKIVAPPPSFDPPYNRGLENELIGTENNKKDRMAKNMKLLIVLIQ
jgi:hypothetical protein